MSNELVVVPGLCFSYVVGCLDSIWVFIGRGEPRFLYAVVHCIPFCSIVHYVTFASSFSFQLLKAGLVKTKLEFLFPLI